MSKIPDGAIRNFKSAEGRELGIIMAGFVDSAEPLARLKFPELPPRCNSCAGRAGNHLASQSVATQMDFVKCIMEGKEFQCHEPARLGQTCSAWAMLVLAEGEVFFSAVPWNFSDAGLDKP